MPAELLAAFKKQPSLKKAFKALTPGRQRGYCLYFSGANQPQTRAARIDRYAAKILSGKGMLD
jgi:uncharacterized protein YdeI (YjbR/CyaY-like superfamily)